MDKKSQPVGDAAVLSYGTALAYHDGDEEYFAGTVVGYVSGGGGALILDTWGSGLMEFTRGANQHLYPIHTRYDELVEERDEWKSRALKAEAKRGSSGKEESKL